MGALRSNMAQLSARSTFLREGILGTGKQALSAEHKLYTNSSLIVQQLRDISSLNISDQVHFMFLFSSLVVSIFASLLGAMCYAMVITFLPSNKSQSSETGH